MRVGFGIGQAVLGCLTDFIFGTSQSFHSLILDYSPTIARMVILLREQT